MDTCFLVMFVSFVMFYVSYVLYVLCCYVCCLYVLYMLCVCCFNMVETDGSTCNLLLPFVTDEIASPDPN